MPRLRKRVLGPLREITITAYPWKWDVVVLQGGTQPEVKAHVHRLMGPDMEIDDKLPMAHAWVFHDKVAVLWIYRVSDYPALSHELIHIVSGILEGRGLTFAAASEEAYTYTVENLFRQILAARKRWRVVKPRRTRIMAG